MIGKLINITKRLRMEKDSSILSGRWHLPSREVLKQFLNNSNIVDSDDRLKELVDHDSFEAMSFSERVSSLEKYLKIESIPRMDWNAFDKAQIDERTIKVVLGQGHEILLYEVPPSLGRYPRTISKFPEERCDDHHTEWKARKLSETTWAVWKGVFHPDEMYLFTRYSAEYPKKWKCKLVEIYTLV